MQRNERKAKPGLECQLCTGRRSYALKALMDGFIWISIQAGTKVYKRLCTYKARTNITQKLCQTGEYVYIQ